MPRLRQIFRGDKSKSDGELIYIRPAISGDEPPDVYNCHAVHPGFPYEPTSDQWFSDRSSRVIVCPGCTGSTPSAAKNGRRKVSRNFFRQVKETLAAQHPSPVNLARFGKKQFILAALSKTGLEIPL